MVEASPVKLIEIAGFVTAAFVTASIEHHPLALSSTKLLCRNPP